jgi:hypothetical protein
MHWRLYNFKHYFLVFAGLYNILLQLVTTTRGLYGKVLAL